MGQKKKFLEAFNEGVRDGYKQGVLQSGITWSDGDDPDYDKLNESYDHGANVGEALHALKKSQRGLYKVLRNGLKYVLNA